MIAFVTFVDHFAKRSSKLIGLGIHLIITVLFTVAFLYFADFAFGMDSKSDLETLFNFISTVKGICFEEMVILLEPL